MLVQGLFLRLQDPKPLAGWDVRDVLKNSNLIRCPQCKRGFLQLEVSISGEAHCDVCQGIYPFKGGILDLVGDGHQKRNIVQYFMESNAIVRIYESRFWRRSLAFSMATGISFKEEYELINQAGQFDKAAMVLDVACGPGIYLRPLAKSFPRGSVVGIDLSLPMLSYASRQIKVENLTNTLLIRANALNLPFPPESFDAVNCCAALHIFPDANRALQEMYRVLQPGGRLILGVFRKNPGMFGTFITSTHKHLMGIDSFVPEELKLLLETLGYDNFEYHHSAQFWLIVSVHKP